MQTKQKILVQCDFDGTVTVEDASFTILDVYTPGKWEKLFEEHKAGGMTVGEFNSRAFSMVKADRESLLKLVDEKIRIRDGFTDFVRYCREKRYKFVIVSNGLDFYIEHLLQKTGFNDIEFHASITTFESDGIVLRHKGPDGKYLDDGVKAAYTDYYIAEGYDVIYLGDGSSDLIPAGKCTSVFATGSLVDYCNDAGLAHTPFNDFHEVMRDMETWL